MSNMANSDEKNMKLCDGCEDCCNHIALEIDKPKTKTDYDYIRWYLLHEGVSVFIDEGDWFLEFKAKCRPLTKDKLCGIYKERPNICRDYSQDDCVKHGEGDAHDVCFKDEKQFIGWLEKKGINWKFKNNK